MGGPGSGRRRTVSIDRKVRLGTYRADRDGPPKRPRWPPPDPPERPHLEEPDVEPTEQPLPQDLGEIGLACWTAMVAYEDFHPVETPLLAVLCQHLDVHAELTAVVRREGALQEGHIHPALVEAREQANVVANLAELLRR